MRRVAFLLLLLGLVASFFFLAQERRPGDIFLITVDTLRADHLGLYGYERPTSPVLDEFFGEDRAAVYTRAYATSAHTAPSIVSILSGRWPTGHRVRLFYQLLGDDVPVLPDLLPDTYVKAAVVSNMVLTSEAIGLSSRFDHYDDFVDERESSRRIYERNARRTTDAALVWLVTAPADRPIFLWVHYVDPHGPYRAPEDRPARFQHDLPIPFDPARMAKYQREAGVVDGGTYIDRYDEEIAYTDEQIGRLLEGLGRERDLDRAVVAFTADHGESMMEHERFFAHGYHVFEEIIRVPLMVRGPGVAVGRDPAPVSGVDLLPTLLRFADVPLPGEIAGVPLGQEGGAPAERLLFAEGGREKHHRAVIRGNRKWIATADREALVRDRVVYDLERDPRERSPQPWSSPDTPGARALGSALRDDPDPGGIPRQFRRGLARTSPKVAPRAGRIDRERLRQLGYVE